jgi:cytokinesis protein
MTAAEELKAREKRKQAADETKANRQKALDVSSTTENEDTSVLDNLLEKLRNGDTVGRRARRARPTADGQSKVPLTLVPEPGANNDTVDIARDMLARLKSDGFEAFAPSPTSPSVTTRPRRRRTGVGNPPRPEEVNEWMMAAEAFSATEPDGSPSMSEGPPKSES